MLKKSFDTKVVSIKIEMSNEWNVGFLQNSPLGIQHTYSTKFPIGQRTSETLFLIWHKALQLYYF